MNRPREFRLFLSSTFRDLQEEREELVKKVFPEFRALCRERGVEFTEIDLRWGLTEEEATQGRVIRACLEEIDRCRPYFIGIIGERIGWVPDAYEIYKDPDLIARYPWVEEEVALGRSLVEIEMRYGAVEPVNRDAAVFRRRPRRHTHEQGDPPLLAMIERLTDHGVALRDYRNAVSLGDEIFDHLTALLDRDFRMEEDPDPLTAERRSHEAFAASRRHAYIPRPALAAALEAELGRGHPVSIVGPSGSGKSAFVAWWSARERERNPARVVVEHYVGLGHGTSQQSLLRHILLELARAANADEDLPSAPEALTQRLNALLARLHDRGCLVIIDGLNQLPRGARELYWLPRQLPLGVDLVVTSTEAVTIAPGEEAVASLEVPPLTEREREAVIVRFLGEYHKSLSPEHVRKIASDPKSAQPLFLRLLLEELRIFGHHSDIADFIASNLATHDTDELFQRVLERLEEDFGARFVRGVMRPLWASRAGIETDALVGIAGAAPHSLKLLVDALGFHLVRRNNRLTFFHSYLARAVHRRYFRDEPDERREHLRLASWLKQFGSVDRQLEEVPWQYAKAGRWEELSELLADGTWTSRLRARHPADLQQFLVALSHNGVDLVTLAKRAASQLLSTSPEAAAEWPLVLHDLGNNVEALDLAQILLQQVPERSGTRALLLLRAAGIAPNTSMQEHSFDWAREALEILKEDPSAGERTLVDALRDAVVAATTTNRFEEAEALADELRTRVTSLPPESTRELGAALNSLALLFHSRGRLDAAEPLYRQAEALADGANDILLHGLVRKNLAALLSMNGRPDEALQLLCETYQQWELLYGCEHTNTVGAALAYANQLALCGRVAEAEALFRRSISGEHGSAGGPTRRGIAAEANLASMLMTQRRYEEAEEIFRNALDEARSLGFSELEAACRTQLGRLLRDTNRLEEAETHLRQAAVASTRIFGQCHPQTVGAYSTLATVLASRGNGKEAERILHRCLADARSLYPSGHTAIDKLERSLAAIVSLKVEG